MKLNDFFLGCPAEFRPFGDSCYYLSAATQKVNYDEASAFCSTMAAHLIIINNNEEQVNGNTRRYFGEEETW